MKKRVIAIIFISLFLISIVSFVSAGPLENLNNWVQKILGKENKINTQDTGELATLTTQNNPELIAHYKFENNLKDSSGKSNDAQRHNIGFLTGVSGYAGSFNGENSYVSLPNTDDFSIQEEITISSWIYPTTKEIGTIVAKNGPYYLGYGNSQLGKQKRKVGAGIYSTTNLTTNSDGGWLWLSGKNEIPLNKWSYVTMSYDGKTLKVYYNAKLENSTHKPGTMIKTGDTPKIGYGTPGFNQYFQGLIDDVKIWNYALTEQEIKSEYEKNKPVIEQKLVAEYKFENNVKDSSHNENDGINKNVEFTEGIEGMGAKFNTENSSVEIKSQDMLNFGQNDFTISLWAEVEGYKKQNSAWNVLISKGIIHADVKPYWTIYIGEDNKIRFSAGDDGTPAKTSESVNDSKKHHIVAVRKGDTLKLYIDQKLQTTGKTPESHSITNTAPIIIGSDQHYGYRDFLGMIDEQAVSQLVNYKY